MPHTGSYKELPALVDKLADALEAAKITDFSSAAIFYDDAEIAGETKCRGEAIAILAPAQFAKLAGNRAFMTRRLERHHYLHTAFPLRGALSLVAARGKVYPLYKKYFTDMDFAPYRYRETGYEGDFRLEVYGPGKIRYYKTFRSKGSA